MSAIEVIAAALSKLPPQELPLMRALLAEHEEAEFDARIEQDALAGRCGNARSQHGKFKGQS